MQVIIVNTLCQLRCIHCTVHTLLYWNFNYQTFWTSHIFYRFYENNTTKNSGETFFTTLKSCSDHGSHHFKISIFIYIVHYIQYSLLCWHFLLLCWTVLDRLWYRLKMTQGLGELNSRLNLDIRKPHHIDLNLWWIEIQWSLGKLVHVNAVSIAVSTCDY